MSGIASNPGVAQTSGSAHSIVGGEDSLLRRSIEQTVQRLTFSFAISPLSSSSSSSSSSTGDRPVAEVLEPLLDVYSAHYHDHSKSPLACTTVSPEDLWRLHRTAPPVLGSAWFPPTGTNADPHPADCLAAASATALLARLSPTAQRSSDASPSRVSPASAVALLAAAASCLGLLSLPVVSPVAPAPPSVAAEAEGAPEGRGWDPVLIKRKRGERRATGGCGACPGPVSGHVTDPKVLQQFLEVAARGLEHLVEEGTFLANMCRNRTPAAENYVMRADQSDARFLMDVVRAVAAAIRTFYCTPRRSAHHAHPGPQDIEIPPALAEAASSSGILPALSRLATALSSHLAKLHLSLATEEKSDRRAPPPGGILTAAHTEVLQISLLCGNYRYAANFATASHPLHSVPFLRPLLLPDHYARYFFLEGITRCALRQWSPAVRAFAQVIAAPPAQTQEPLDVPVLLSAARRRMILAGLLYKGKVPPLPRGVSAAVAAVLAPGEEREGLPSTHWLEGGGVPPSIVGTGAGDHKAFTEAFLKGDRQGWEKARTELRKTHIDEDGGDMEDLLGEDIRRRAVCNLAGVYETLPVDRMAELLGLKGGEGEAKGLLLNMVARGQSVAHLDENTGLVHMRSPEEREEDLAVRMQEMMDLAELIKGLDIHLSTSEKYRQVVAGNGKRRGSTASTSGQLTGVPDIAMGWDM